MNKVLKYNEMLNEIAGEENHLLLANGFNQGLGVDTSYKHIFENMINGKCNGIYENARELAIRCGYDLEMFVEELVKDIDSQNEFLKKFVSNKIKLDFMEATQRIVKKSIKNIYAEDNEGIYMLLNNFTNYFTLNYDSFLYLLLLQYKNDDGLETSVAFTPSLKFIEDDLNEKEDEIYKEVKSLRRTGKTDISSENENISIDLSVVTRSEFANQVKLYNKTKKKNWKTSHIDKVVDYILSEEKNNKNLENNNDGFIQTKLSSDPIFQSENKLQNVFFLHGAFHIYEEKNKIMKITQKQDQALYNRLEEIINADDKNIITVFQPYYKLSEINKNEYLKSGISKLGALCGNVVILGSSLAENDNHIFEAINNSSIEKVFISAYKNAEETEKRAKQLFPQKKIYVFDAETISYSLQ